MTFHPPDSGPSRRYGDLIAGRYQIAGQPLLGGMGIVYLCHDLQQDRPVALKTFQARFLPDHAARQAFLREGNIWVALGSHPHIVRCFAVEYIGDGREVYLVLELVAREEGRADASLRAFLLPGRPLPPDQALLFALQIARGMAHATSIRPGLVHRDLKPENVLVGADWLDRANANRLRVTDFGLVRFAEALPAAAPRPRPAAHTTHGARPGEDAPMTRSQPSRRIAGTPQYMAPEQWRWEPLSAATDIYALGCILYEMLAGRPAVEGHSHAALRQAHCQGMIQPLPAGLPGGARRLTLRCLALAAADRYAQWTDVEAALAAAYREVTGRAAPGRESRAELSRAERVAAGWSYSALGLSYRSIGQAPEALRLFQRAATIARAEGDPRLEAASLTHQGLAHDALGDPQQATSLHRQALAISRHIGDLRGQRDALGNLADACLSRGDLQASIRHHRRALALSRRMGDPVGEGNSLNSLGLVFSAQGDAGQAISLHTQARQIARQTSDARAEANALGNLGTAFLAKQDPWQAAGFYRQQFDICTSIADRRGECNALGGLAQAAAELNNWDEAFDYARKQLTIAREIDDCRGEANALSTLARVHVARREPAKAVDLLQAALEIDLQIGDWLDIGTDGANLALALLEAAQPRQALASAQQAVRDFGEGGYTEQAQQTQQLVGHIRATLTDFPAQRRGD